MYVTIHKAWQLKGFYIIYKKSKVNLGNILDRSTM